MRKIKNSDGYELSTGKRIYPNKGIIGLTEYKGFKIYEGYDGSWLTEDEVSDEFIELTMIEIKEIALYMINIWNEFYKSILNG